MLLARMSRDRDVMGEYRSGRGGAAAQMLTIGVLAVCVVALLALTMLPA